ncbi:MAG: hypothetical protein Tsb0015_10570 [Simkaniaceae bacterium]
MKELFDALIERQRKKLFALAKEIIPHITPDDLLQPFDFPQLENHGYFRYEEGVLEGLMTARAAVLASQKEKS